jgi:hypothetical protein
MYEEFGVAARRFFVRQVCVSHIGGLIVIPFNSELIYRHLDVPLLSIRDTAAPAASSGDHRGWCVTEPLLQAGLVTTTKFWRTICAPRGSRGGRRDGSAIPIATHRSSQSKNAPRYSRAIDCAIAAVFALAAQRAGLAEAMPAAIAAPRRVSAPQSMLFAADPLNILIAYPTTRRGVVSFVDSPYRCYVRPSARIPFVTN